MADINRILIGEYLESLKEDGELDHIFPLLLEMMEYRILSKPKNAKGQSQYGKDVVAIKEIDGVSTRFYFELKGGSDRNIDDHVLNKRDGVIESMRAAKNTPYLDKTIPNFEAMPAKYYLVHNGLLKENAKPTLNGFIEREFEPGEFDRWDIDALSRMFSENLFNEYMLVEGQENVSLFKKTLALLDVPEYDLNHFYKLINTLCENTKSGNQRYRNKFYSSLALIGMMIYTYCKSFNNLERAKLCMAFIVLKAWRWTVQNKLENKPTVLKSFELILGIQLVVYRDYFDKTIPIAMLPNGLFSEQGGDFEEIAYPIRSTEFINYLIYYIRLRNYFKPDTDKTNEVKGVENAITQNYAGMSKPLLDNQAVAYVNAFTFLLQHQQHHDTREFLKGYLDAIFNSLCIVKNLRHRFPELRSNEEALTTFIADAERPYNYEDSSSTLILILFELTICLNAEDVYNKYRQYFVDSKINLQTFYHTMDDQTPIRLFDKEIRDEGYSETNIELPETFQEFVTKMKAKNRISLPNENDAIMGLVKLLAHVHFKTPFFTNDWRSFF